MTEKLTKDQAVIISGFTGILCGEFSDFHADVEKRLGRDVQTFEFGFKEFMAEVKKLYEADFIKIGTIDSKAAKAQAVPESNALLSDAMDAVQKLGSGDFVLVSKEPSTELVNHGHDVFLGHFNEGSQTGGRSLYFAYKAMIEAQEQSHD